MQITEVFEREFYIQVLTEENESLISEMEHGLEKLNEIKEDPGYIREGSENQYLFRTRMHFNRMRTVCGGGGCLPLVRGGGLSADTPLGRPLCAAPTPRQTPTLSSACWGNRPPPPGEQNPRQA